MRITIPLARKSPVTGDSEKWVPHKLYFGHARGRKNIWGPKRQNYYWTKKFNYLWRLDAKRPVLLSNEELPPNTVVHDANELAKVQLYHTDVPEVKIGNPYPFTEKIIPGSLNDPRYKSQVALCYNSRFTLYEGIKGVNHFTHSVVEEEPLPSCLQGIEDNLKIEEKFENLLDRRLNHALTGDSSMILMPRLKDFPRLNFIKPRQTGIHPFRRDTSVLKAYCETSNMMLSSSYGLNKCHIIDWPACVVPFRREDMLCILDLKADFVTACRSVSPIEEFLKTQKSNESGLPNGLKVDLTPQELMPFSSDPETTIHRELPAIDPVDWRINFEETARYSTQYCYSIPRPFNVSTIFLSNNNVNPKPQPDRMVFARGILFCYGYLAARARLMQALGVEEMGQASQTTLSTPLAIQLAFFNASKNNIGFISFQLNTTSFNTPVKNQVWLDGPYSIDDRRVLFRKFVARDLLSQGYLERTDKASN